MYNTSNPAELYPNTTWELLPNNKFLKTGTTPLQVGGSNSIKIAKTNLPTDKLQVESHSMTRGTMNITGSITLVSGGNGGFYGSSSGAFTNITKENGQQFSSYNGGTGLSKGFNFNASSSWGGATSSASPYTTAMGSGTPLTINPEHITIKAWKRLT